MRGMVCVALLCLFRRISPETGYTISLQHEDQSSDAMTNHNDAVRIVKGGTLTNGTFFICLANQTGLRIRPGSICIKAWLL